MFQPMMAVSQSQKYCIDGWRMDRDYFPARPSSNSFTLTIGERVVLFPDGDAEYGTVQWIGNLPGLPDVMAGVNFDNPIGSGNGSYCGKRLFHTRMNHAALVPIGGLLRAVDYDRETTAFGALRKDLLIDLDAAADTSIWSVDEQTPVPISPSEPTLMDTDNKGIQRLVEKTTLESSSEVRVGEPVEVSIYVNITTPDLRRYGIVRWIGDLPGKEQEMVGVELDADLPYWVRCGTDGIYQNVRYFSCHPKRGVFLSVSSVHPYPSDPRPCRSFNDILPKYPEPWTLSRLNLLFGKPKGIQGRHNSCYMDATLFALFAATDAYDNILSRPRKRSDIELYDEIRTCLKFYIVEPLRKRGRGFVDDESVMKLRRLLSHALPNVTGLTTDEKDPEELINLLFGSVLRVVPDIHLTSGQSTHICQLIVEDAYRKTPLTSVQTLLERSFFWSNVQLLSIPNRLIVQVPRYGKQKLYDYIVPSLQLDLSNVLANHCRRCGMCGHAAQWQCKECYLIETNDLAMTFFCNLCFGKFHSSLRQNNDHQLTPLSRESTPGDSSEATLELASVVCIEMSHYVSFVRIQENGTSRWVFFDSMADREGGDVTGHNLPEVVGCDEYFEELLKPENRQLLLDALPLPVNRDDIRRRRFGSDPLPPYMERLLQDCYICVYVQKSQWK